MARIESIQAQRHVVSVSTPSGNRKIFSLQFSRSDGTLLVHFPYFSRTEGFLSCADFHDPEGADPTIEFRKHAVETTERVKFSYHPDGTAHFSQTDKVKSKVRHRTAPLDRRHGPVFVLVAQGLHEFKSTVAPTPQQRSTINSTIPLQCNHEPAAVQFVGHWRRRSELSAMAEDQGSVGPYVHFRWNGVLPNAVILGPERDRPPREHVLVLTWSLREAQGSGKRSFLAFMGAANPRDEAGNAPARNKALMLVYPKEAVADLPGMLPSIDLR